MSDLINVEAEQQLLGAILLDPGRIDIIGSLAKPEIFGDPAHRDLFREILARHRRGEPISPVSMAQYARAHLVDLGGPKYLARLAAASVASDMVMDYARLLEEQRAIRAIGEAIEVARVKISGGKAKASEIAAGIEAALSDGVSTGDEIVSMMRAATDALKIVSDARSGDRAGVLTGIEPLDRIIGRLEPGHMMVLGGRPSMGKTAVALCIALNVARAGGGVAIASLEMTPEAMAMRAISEGTARLRDAVAYSEMRRGGLSDRQLETIARAASDVADLPIRFFPASYRDAGSIYIGARRARSMLGDAGLKLVIVDYMQLMEAAGRSRVEQITEISIALKSLAMRLEVPVIALSQLSRSIEARADKRPIMSDLRESGQIEQDADIIAFCYRDEYYLEREMPDESSSDREREAWQAAMERSRGKMQLIVAKNRGGATGVAKLQYNPAANRVWW